MKKLFLSCLTFATLLFCACGGDSASNSNDEEETSSSSNKSNSSDANESSSSNAEDGNVNTCKVESGDDWVTIEIVQDSSSSTISKFTYKGDSIYVKTTINLGSTSLDTTYTQAAGNLTYDKLKESLEKNCKQFPFDDEESSSSVAIDTSYLHYSSSSAVLGTCEFTKSVTDSEGDSTYLSAISTYPDSATIKQYAVLYSDTAYLLAIDYNLNKKLSKASLEAACNDVKTAYPSSNDTITCSGNTITVREGAPNKYTAEIYFEQIAKGLESNCSELNKNTAAEKACAFDIKDSVWFYYTPYSGMKYIVQGDTVQEEHLNQFGSYDEKESCEALLDNYKDYDDAFCSDSILFYALYTTTSSISNRYESRIQLYESIHQSCLNEELSY